jgi:hypothetical protein
MFTSLPKCPEIELATNSACRKASGLLRVASIKGLLTFLLPNLLRQNLAG